MNTNLARFFLAAALVVLPVSAPAEPANAAAQRITGSWTITISVDGANAPFTIDMTTYHPDGSLTVISSDKSESNGVGSYLRTGDGEFLSTHTQVVYNEKGTFAALAKVVALVKLSDTADTFNGKYRVDILDVNGKLLQRITGSIGGKLVVPEPL